jgi:hypothetical protein
VNRALALAPIAAALDALRSIPGIAGTPKLVADLPTFLSPITTTLNEEIDAALKTRVIGSSGNCRSPRMSGSRQWRCGSRRSGFLSVLNAVVQRDGKLTASAQGKQPAILRLGEVGAQKLLALDPRARGGTKAGLLHTRSANRAKQAGSDC